MVPAMLAWLAGQSIPLIGVIACAWSSLMAAAIYGAVAVMARRGHGAMLKSASPVTLTPLAVIFGLLVGFLAADVWPNFERARAVVAQEAGALHQAALLADALPAEERGLVKSGLREYVTRAVKEEWPALAAASQSLKTSTNGLGKILTMLLTRRQDGINRLAVDEHIVQALERALDARRQRILMSYTAVSGIKWFVFMVLAGLIELTIAMVHVDERGTQVITMLIFATAVAVSALLIMAYDRRSAGAGFRCHRPPWRTS
jgi:hypothetical protein